MSNVVKMLIVEILDSQNYKGFLVQFLHFIYEESQETREVKWLL